MTSIIPSSKRDKLKETIVDPILFTRRWLQSDTWDIQDQILTSLATRRRTAVKACHASGKTFLAACAALWFLARWKNCVVISTAPTWPQVEQLLWGEVHAALSRSRYPFPKANATELWLEPHRYAVGRSTSVTKQDEGVKFQGIHAEHVLIIFDEAPGIDPKIFDAAEGIRAGGDVRSLELGNPTISSGSFYDLFKSGRGTSNLFTISAFDTPNFRDVSLTYKDAATDQMVTLGSITGRDLMVMSDEELDDNERPYLITKRWVKERYLEWGPGHALWESRVLGQFPSQSEDALISMKYLEKASRPYLDDETGPITAGLDVAGPGEAETVLVIRQGRKIISLDAWPYEDPRGDVIAKLNTVKDRLTAVNVDSNGVGWGIYQHLLDKKFPAKAINVGEAARDKEKYVNLKAELYWQLRLSFLAYDVLNMVDEKTFGQLASIRYRHNSHGQVTIESKEEARKRGVKSPDRAEAMMLAFADVPNVLDGFIQYYASITKKTEEPRIHQNG